MKAINGVVVKPNWKRICKIVGIIYIVSCILNPVLPIKHVRFLSSVLSNRATAIKYAWIRETKSEIHSNIAQCKDSLAKISFKGMIGLD